MTTNDEIIKKRFPKVRAIYNADSKFMEGENSYLNEARASQLEEDIEILKEMEKRANFTFVKGTMDLANKKYERGFFDGIHNAISKLKEAKP